MFKAVPIDMISEPNVYAPLPNSQWVITSPNQQTLWFRIDTQDSLGQRPYMLAAGGTIKLTFYRADSLSVDTRGSLVSTSRNVEKTATAATLNRSLFKITCTSQDIQNILSGSIKFELTESSVTTAWMMNFAVKKMLTDPGH